MTLSSVIRFPCSLAAMQRCAHSMRLRSGLPGIVGAIDGSHIRVHPTRGVNSAYFNYKHFYSVNKCAVVDPRGYFMSLTTGFPGKFHDAGCLRVS